ncbi:MAG: DUF433 domain-containing protein [Phycisphaerae bacterium]|nr:DUF433 domain-containing protein [Saprospiraceae bacterium]
MDFQTWPIPTGIVSSDPETLNGALVFKDTRVPVESLFWHLEKGVSLDEFLDDFPSVTRAQAEAVLQIAKQLFQTPNFQRIYAVAA